MSMEDLPPSMELEPTVNLNDIHNASPDSSSSSDDDAVNTTQARVYFGPLQSPEKKLIQVGNPTPFIPRALPHDTNGSPIRRSARFPSPSRTQDQEDNMDNSDANNESDEAGEDVSQSRSGTPDNIRFPPDEPSSVLASRIFRAHDNPSPPPRARHVHSLASSPLKDASFPSSSGSPSVEPPDAHITMKYRTMFDRPSSASPSPPDDTSSIPPPVTLRRASLSPSPQPNTPQRDLISFESFTASNATLGTSEVQRNGPFSGPSLDIPHTSQHTTVDDLLSQSPVAPSPRHPPSPVRFQLEELNNDNLRPRSPSPIRRSPRLIPIQDLPYENSPTKTPPPAEVLPKATPNDERRPRTPRRSPRRSVTPLSLKPHIASSPPPVPPLPPGIQAPPLSQPNPETPLPSGDSHKHTEPQSGAETRKKRWKGKARATSPLDEVVGDSQEGSDSGEGGEREVEEHLMEEGVRHKEKGKRRQDHGKEKEAVMRELGSLSPDSANVLAQLFPSIDATMAPQLSPMDVDQETPQDPTSSIFPPKLNPLLASVQRPPPGSPARFNSPSRHPASPAKLVTGNDLEDPTRTPARRVPMRQAMEQGTASAQKLYHLNHLKPNDNALAASLRSPVFTRPALDDPLRSPAKRIPISEVMASGQKGSNPRYGSRSPTRGLSRERSASAEPKARSGRERSTSVEPHQKPMKLPSTSTSSRPSAKLPYPLVKSQSSVQDRPTSIPEENEGPEVPSDTQSDKGKAPSRPYTSPAKSHLKQTSGSSKIPRIGAKPYARPVANTKESKLPTVVKKADTKTLVPTKTKTVRIVKSGDNTSSSDEPATGPSSLGHAKGSKETPSSVILKRKRGPEKISPPVTRPVVLIRQVVPGMLGPKYAPSSLPAPASPAPTAVPVNDDSPFKKTQRPTTMRRVIDRPQEHIESTSPEEDITTRDVAEPAQISGQDENSAGFTSGQSQKDGEPPSPPLQIEPVTPTPDIMDIAATSTPDDDDVEPSMRVRRTTRSRKTAQQTNDIFTAPRPLQSRRKPTASNRSEADRFSGLSAVALKALTSSNTTRNQQNFVSLATEVIRRDGCRPESPIMKVRTISQREAEEKARGRSERAHRRSQRSDDGMSDLEGLSSDIGDSSMVEVESDEDDFDANGQKHRRGAGDDEDYETPAKPSRPLKRPRFVQESEESEDDIQSKKRVKWDRGLYSEVYLDEIEVNPRRPSKEDTTKKGCLAPTAKALRLDTLGNIINADSPLSDLVHENITIKKFVYDNDIEPEAPVVKSTRSRGKKGRS